MASTGDLGCCRSTINHRWVWLLPLLATVTFAVSPAPLSVAVDTQRWVGYDGNWSPVTLRVGTPPQWVYVLPNIIGQEIWVIGPGGCDESFTCQEERGGIFNASQSSSWKDQGPYELGFNLNLGFQGSADYGYDSVALDQETIALGQVIAILNDTQFLTGSMGLGVGITDFTGSSNLTFLSTLVENNSAVPSHSFGYTAGAYYRLKSVPASLVFGGVDTNRFEPNNKTFTLDSKQRPVVSINEITVSAQSTNNFTSPLTLSSGDDAALFTIDSSTPFLWLPENVCDRFANALGLFYNETLQVYTFEGNARNQSDLAEWDMTFTFTIADLPDSSNSIELQLPYDAFDLELTFPFPHLDANSTSPATKYFPLRRAANETQYTIGRMFLQETYLTVDYERNNFSLSQAKFSLDATTNTNLVEITRPANSGFVGPESSASGLSTTRKIGVGVGIGCGILILGLIILFIFARRRKARKGRLDKPESPARRPFLRLISSSRASQATSKEIPDSPAIELPGSRSLPSEVPADSSTSRFELEAQAPVEMEGSHVPETYYSNQSRRSIQPVELPVHRRTSTSKVPFTLPGRRRHSDQADNLPAYTPTSESHGISDISRNSVTGSRGRGSGFPFPSPTVSPTTAITPRSGTDGSRRSSNLSPVSPNRTSRGTGSGTGTGSSSNYGSLPSSIPSRSISNPNSNPGGSDGGNSNNLQIPGRHAATSSIARSISSRSSRFVEQGLVAQDPPSHSKPNNSDSRDKIPALATPSSPRGSATNDAGNTNIDDAVSPIAPPVGFAFNRPLDGDSGYQLRDPNSRDHQDPRRLESLTRRILRQGSSQRSGNRSENSAPQEAEGEEEKRRKRFSWEDRDGDG